MDILRRRAGVMIPLSALRSERDCGIGEISALEPFFDWMLSAGLTVLQLLPLNDLAPLDSCPYSSVSAFAMDTVYISLLDVPEIRRSPALQAEIESARVSGPLSGPATSRRAVPGRSPSVPGSIGKCFRPWRARFAEVRAFKLRMLESAFQIFDEQERSRQTPRARDFENFTLRHRDWLEDYALFRALKEWSGWRSWTHWPAEIKERAPEALAHIRAHHARRMSFYQYLQWLVDEQWMQARKRAAERGILLYGDIPFGLSLESADVWARQRDFDFSASMGAPPDQYSATGQSWDLPAYRWDAMEAGGHVWWRGRVRRACELYDLFRLDHAVGLFRTWRIPEGDGPIGFDIEGEDAQRARGERFLRMTLEEAKDARPIAEDLGVIPPFVREVLSRLEIPGYKVTRWETSGDGFQHPRDFPRVSVATPGNHDTSTLAEWWREMTDLERDRYWEMATARKEPAPRFSPLVHETLLRNLYEAHSALVMLPFQDIVGSRVRVNVPGTVGPYNWTYRMPWTVEQLASNERVACKTSLLARLAEATGRRMSARPVETQEKTC